METVYCPDCQADQEIDTDNVIFKDGKTGFEAPCPSCGTVLFKPLTEFFPSLSDADSPSAQAPAGRQITLGKDLTTALPVTLSDRDRKQGTYVIGLTGTGKTTLLLNIVLALSLIHI